MDSKTLHRELQRAKRAQLSDQPLRQTFRARHQALISGRRAAEARSADSIWLDVCPAYRSAREAGAPDDADVIEVHGLTIFLPRTADASGHAKRLREGWLPLREMLSQRELGLGPAMIDIGANVGTTSIPRVIAGDVQRVYAIEPEPANYRCLVQNIVANGLAGFVLPDSCAISNRSGEALLRQASGLGAHRILTEKAARRGRPDTIPVPTWTLDDWLRERQVDPEEIWFVKVDTQGWESHVLAGAGRLLACRHVAWALEVSPKHLSAAGTPVSELLRQLRQHFTHAIDLRAEYAKSRVVSVDELPEVLGYLDHEGPSTYTNLLLYHES